jgi:hypothetical protein
VDAIVVLDPAGHRLERHRPTGRETEEGARAFVPDVTARVSRSTLQVPAADGVQGQAQLGLRPACARCLPSLVGDLADQRDLPFLPLRTGRVVDVDAGVPLAAEAVDRAR